LIQGKIVDLDIEFTEFKVFKG